MTPPKNERPTESHWAFHVDPGTEIRRIGKVHLPVAVEARGVLPQAGVVVGLQLELERDRYVIDVIQVQRVEGQRPITASRIASLALDDLVMVCTNLLSYYIADQLGDEPDDTWPDEVTKSVGARTRRTITPELLAEVAVAYDKTPTVQHVMFTFHVSRRTAQRYIQLAREAGLIKGAK